MKQFLNRTVSGMVVILLLTSVLTAFYIQTVKASPQTIYISADGSIDPPTAPISSLDNVTYTLTGIIYDEIVVERNNIVVDGAAYTIQGTWDEAGIDLSGRSNVTIKNTEIKSFTYGIRLDGSSNNTIIGNNITETTWGIYLLDSSNNTISGNNIIENNEIGIKLFDSSNNTVFGNNITENDLVGIELTGSSNNTFRNNDISKHRYNFGVGGSLLSDYIQDMDDSNTVDGKPVYYWVNRKDMAIPLDAGFIALINCTRMTVKDLDLANEEEGVLLAFTTNSTITKNNMTNNWHGILLHESSNNTISGNNITENEQTGIWLRASNNTVSGNNIANNGYGIRLLDSSNNTISGNYVANNGYGIGPSSNNIVSENNITMNSYYGITLLSNNIVSENTVTNNWHGIMLSYSTNNTLRNNNVSKNIYNFGVYGSLLSDYIQDIDDSNTVDGKPVYYWVNRRESAIPLDAGWVALINCTHIMVNNLSLTNSEQGILLAFTIDSTITKNNMTNNWHGILLHESSNNTVSGNTVTNNKYGIILNYSINNTIYHNDFIDNTNQASVTAGYTNIWDDGYPSGGNYWSDHVCTGNPSDGSQPYVIDANNTDHYPFEKSGWWLPPAIVVLSPQNTSYATSSVPLNFTISEPASWMGYSLDGQQNVTITGNTTLSGLSDGSHSLIVFANDTAGNMGFSDIVYFTVDTLPPTAEAGMDQTVDEDTIVTLDGSNSIDIVGIVNYVWNFTDVTPQTLRGVKPTYTFETPGVYTVTLNVTDVGGNWDTDEVVITVFDVTDPVADAGPDQMVDEDTLVTFDGSNSTDNGGIVNYTWAFTDVTPKNLTGVNPTYNFTNPGTYVVTLNVTDAAGHSDTDNITITVNDITPPVADAGSDQTAKMNEEVSFDADGSSDNVGVVSYEWNFGDGTTGTGITTTHTYNEPGTYTVTLNVTDAAGNSETDTITITIEKAPGFPLTMMVGIGSAAIVIIAAAYFLVIRKPSL